MESLRKMDPLVFDEEVADNFISPTLFNIYTSDLPPPSAPVQVMAYADDITITSTHTSTSAAKNTYNHTYTKFLPGQNKTTSY